MIDSRAEKKEIRACASIKGTIGYLYELIKEFWRYFAEWMEMVTQRQIAEQLHLTQQTVSLCFRRPELVSEETRRQVLSLARRLGYRPNSAAQAIVRGRFGNVALIQDTVRQRTTLPQLMLDGIQEELERHDLNLILCSCTPEQMSQPDFVPKVLRESLVDGLLINFNSDPSERLTTLIDQYRMPSVWLNIRRASDCVHPDDYDAGRQLTESLLASGRERIAYLDYSYRISVRHYSKSDRLRGFRDVIAERKIESFEVLLEGGLDASELSKQTCNLMRRLPKNCGIMTYGIREIEGVLHQLLCHEQPICSGELQLGTFCERHDFDFLSVHRMIHPAYDVGRRSVLMLMQKILKPDVLLEPCPVPFQLWVGDNPVEPLPQPAISEAGSCQGTPCEKGVRADGKVVSDPMYPAKQAVE